MNIDLNGLVILVFAILPGFITNEVFKIYIGYTNQDEKWSDLVGSIIFSLIGLYIYVFMLSKLKFIPFPIYLQPSSFTIDFLIDHKNIETLLFSLFLHIVCSFISGIIIIKLLNWFNAKSPITTHQNTWTEFCRKFIDMRYVYINTIDERIFKGKVELINELSKINDRDVILEDPEQLEKDYSKSTNLPYKYLFIPGEKIKYIASTEENTNE